MSAAVGQDDLRQLRDHVKQLQKREEGELPKLRKAVDSLEQYVIKSLKNQLNEDNKRS